MIWRTRAEHAAEEAAPPPEAEGQALVEALRAQVTLMRAWANDEQRKREAAEDARVEARSRAAELENAQLQAHLENEIRMVNERDEDIARLRAEVAFLGAQFAAVRRLVDETIGPEADDAP